MTVAPMLNRAAGRNGSCCGAPPGPDCDDRTRPKREQRHVEKRKWRCELDCEAGDVSADVAD